MDLTVSAIIGGSITLLGKIIFDWLKGNRSGNGKDSSYELLIRFDLQMEAKTKVFERMAQSLEEMSKHMEVLREQIQNLPEKPVQRHHRPKSLS